MYVLWNIKEEKSISMSSNNVIIKKITFYWSWHVNYVYCKDYFWPSEQITGYIALDYKFCMETTLNICMNYKTAHWVHYEPHPITTLWQFSNNMLTKMKLFFIRCAYAKKFIPWRHWQWSLFPQQSNSRLKTFQHQLFPKEGWSKYPHFA